MVEGKAASSGSCSSYSTPATCDASIGPYSIALPTLLFVHDLERAEVGAGVWAPAAHILDSKAAPEFTLIVQRCED